MIKVKTYEQQVTPANMPVASPTPTKVPADAFGVGLAETGAKVGKEISEVGGLLAKHMIARQEQRDNADVLSNDLKVQKDLQDLLYNQESGLLNKQGLDADGITKTYDAKAKEIFGKHIMNLPGENQRLAAQRLFDSHALALRGQLVPHEAKEVRAGNMSVLGKNIDESFSLLANNPTAIGDMDYAFGILEARKPEILKLVGNDGYNELVTKKMSAFGVATIKALAESGNIEGANDALNKHGKAMTPAAVAEARAWITNKKGTFDVFATVDAMKNDPTLRNPDGSPNLEKGLAAIEAKYGIKAGATSGFKNLGDFKEVDQGLIKQWVKGDTENVNPVLLSRLAKLGRDKGIVVDLGGGGGARTDADQERLWNEATQDQRDRGMVAAPGRSRHLISLGGNAVDLHESMTVLKGMTNEELKKYGLHKPVNANSSDWEDWHVEPIETAGMTHEKLKGIVSGSSGGGFDETKYNKAVALWKAEIANDAAKKAQEFDGIQTRIVEWVKANGNATTQDAVNFVDKLGLGNDGAKIAKALQFTQTMLGLVNVKTDFLAFSEARREIEGGATYADVALRYSDRIGKSHLASLQQYEKIGREHLVNDVVGKLFKQLNISDNDKGNLQLQVMERVNQEVKTWADKPENKGKQLTQADVVDIYQKQIAKVVLSQNRFGWGTQEGRMAQVPSWLKVDDKGVYLSVKDAKGNDIYYRPSSYDKATRKFTTWHNNKQVDMEELYREYLAKGRVNK